MADNNRNGLDLMRKLPGWITGLIAFVTAVVGFVKLWQGDTGLVTIALLAVGVGGGWLGCLYLRARKRDIGRVLGYRDNKPLKVMAPYYPKWARRLALAGLVIIPLLAAGEVSYHLYQQPQPPAKVILLVADLDGPEPDKYRVTKTVWENLSLALEKYDDVQVERLEQVFETSADARAEGEKRKAAIVIWGWYGATAEVVPLSVHFEVLRPSEYMPELCPAAKGQVRKMAVSELESFTLQTRLSAEMAYLSLFTVGMARYAAKDWGGAIARFSDALSQTAERMPALDQGTVHFYRGLAYGQKGDYDRAITDFDQAIRLQPDDANAYVNRGNAYDGKDDYDRAIADYTKAIQLQPDDAEAYYNRGNTYAHKGDYDRAIADYDKTIKFKPDFVCAYNDRGVAYYNKGDYDRAIADYDQAIQLEPDDTCAYNNRGNAYYNKGNYDRAIADLDQAIQFQPDFVMAYINRGNAYGAKGNYNRAIADYDQAIQLKPDDAGAYKLRGDAYGAKGDYDHAIADYDRAIQLKPDCDACTYNDRGLAYYYKGDYDRAIADYDQAIQLQPDYANAYYGRGLAYIAKAEKERAITDFKKVRELTNDPYWRQQAEEQLKVLGAK